MNSIIWLAALFFFGGVWAEIAINLGFVGLVVGWFPAFVVTYIWLSLTGRFENASNFE